MLEDNSFVLPTLSDDLLSRFKKYFVNERENEPYFLEYKDVIKTIFDHKSDDKFLQQFFSEFQLRGGGIQSGGGRDNPDFEATLHSQWALMKPFLFEPFADDFNVEKWLVRLDDFSHFGRGCATIYLNRIAPEKYPVLNGKSVAAFEKLFRKKLPSNPVKAYPVLMLATDMLMTQYSSTFKDKTELDSFFHFIVAVDTGEQAFADFQTLAEQDDRNFENQINAPAFSVIEDKRAYQSEQRARSQKLRQMCLDKYKCYCHVCEFVFSDMYGEIGNGFIEVHHLNPLAQKKPNAPTTVDELRPVCANCHRMLHRKNSDGTYHTMESMRRIIKKHKKQTI